MKILSKKRLLRQAAFMRRGPKQTTSPLDRVYREIAVLKKLDHPNVVKLVEVLDDPLEDSLYMVFEWVKKGEVLSIPTDKPLPEDRAWSVFRDCLLGLEYLHYQKIIHADLKPGNLLLTECGHVKIADLGVCNEFLGEDAIMSNGSTGGTPAFRAPETLVLGKNVYCGRAADVWALGATLYSLVYGNVPFLATSIPILYEKIKNDAVVLPDTPIISGEIKHCILRMLEKDPTYRINLPQLKLPELVNSLSEHGQLPLQMALSAKNIQIAKTLVNNGSADVNAYDAKGSTLLIDAVRRADHFAANFLLSQKCLVDLLSRPSADTALHIVCSYGETQANSNDFTQMTDIGKQIIDCKPNVNIKNMHGQTALHLAITFNNMVMVNLLLDVPDIDINLRTNDEKCPLELSLTAFNKESFNLAERLLKMGANVNPLKSDTKNSLLQVLTLAGQDFENAAIFLADFANLNHLNNCGMSAVHIAVQQNMPKLVAKLLNAGASPNIQTSAAKMKSPLHVAVEVNAREIIETFANFRKDDSEKIDFNCKDVNGDSPLSLCLALDRIELAPILIAGGADVNARNSQDLTLLHQSIINGDSEKSVFLLDQGAEINALTGEQKSALQLAISYHLPKVVDALCIKGVDLSTLDNTTDSPLWTALELGFEDVAQILVRHGVDTDCWNDGPDGCQQTLLHRAIDENNESIAMFLVRNQCDLDSPRQPGPNGSGGEEARDKASPLHLCCQWNLTKVVQALIDHGANVNAVDFDNKTAAHIAIENQHEDIINILLCHPGIDLKLRDKSGLTPFATALAIRNHKAAQRILERLPNAAEIMDQRGRNFLHVAILKDDLESVLFLLSIQVDVNSRVHDAYQSTSLHLAAASKNEMIIRNLILAGARVNERDSVQKMPLHIAIERGNLSAVSALIQNNADYDAIDADGNNALHLAVHSGQLAIVRELLTESRVNAEATNAKGRNPLHELCRIGEDNSGAAICELFLECMPKYPINVPDMDGNTPLLLSYMRGQAPLCKVLVKVGACLGAQNRDGISIFNYKLATDQLLSKLLDQLPQESPWAESELCQECGLKFSLTIRRHHCRHCGRVLCSKCSNNDVPILKFGINKPVRVCNVCFDVLHGGS
ncbi:GH22346 [Drosophila grimshawi]|uniref:GH22346 n=1 Tax=Drosophila grimshawi TaxID=7222 RepID=B4JYT6_DROGR|nr:GH22346 [Drosophila grimshawi]